MCSPMQVLEEMVLRKGLEIFFGSLYIANTDLCILPITDLKLMDFNQHEYVVRVDSSIKQHITISKSFFDVQAYGVSVNGLSQNFYYLDEGDPFVSAERTYQENTYMAFFGLLDYCRGLHKYYYTAEYANLACWELELNSYDNDLIFSGLQSLHFTPRAIGTHKYNTIFREDSKFEKKLAEREFLPKKLHEFFSYIEPGIKIKTKRIRKIRSLVKRKINVYNTTVTKEYWNEILKVIRECNLYNKADSISYASMQATISAVNAKIEENYYKKH